MFYIGHLPEGLPPDDAEAKYLGMWQLIQCVAQAVGAYCNSLTSTLPSSVSSPSGTIG